MSARRISVIGDISEEAFALFCDQLSDLEEENDTPIELELYSEGGDAQVALAFVSRMRRSLCHISVVGYGYVASAAVLILACGDYRTLTRESWIMVHEDSGNFKGSHSDAEISIRQSAAWEKQWNEIMAEKTKASYEFWAEKKRDTYFTAQQCLEFGLIDEVI